jgi:hypothetical protein
MVELYSGAPTRINPPGIDAPFLIVEAGEILARDAFIANCSQ